MSRLTETSEDGTSKHGIFLGDIDYFFVACADASLYIIPFAAVEGLRMATVTGKYDPYRVQ